MRHRIFLFGEAAQGEWCTPLRLNSLPDLYERLGEPPSESQGIDYAVQALLCNRDCIFYRVKEEGFSKEDYLKGIKLLDNHGHKMSLSAIFIPGVGDKHIIEEISPVCQKLKTVLILTQKDLYDYLTE